MNDKLLMMIGILIPFLGTVVGVLPTLFIHKLNEKMFSVLLGFAAGVMLASSVWSLLIPSLTVSTLKPQWIETVVGYFCGILAMLAIDKFFVTKNDGDVLCTKKTVFAITIHNIPEGMAVGIAVAAAINHSVSLASATILAIGVAVQNIPEGGIVSMPLASGGMKKKKAVFYGVMSGVAEMSACICALLFTTFIIKLLPISLAFAAGAMQWVAFRELLPQVKSNAGGVAACSGFVVMMLLDVILA